MINYSNNVHLVSFDVPYPPDYGGVIDVFYKIKALNEAGVNVILHAFKYGRNKSSELEGICKKVYYYSRKTYINPYTGNEPYIVKSRKIPALLDRLSKDKFPVIFEGVHCCAYLASPELKDKIKIVRMHNIEHLYYLHLAKSEKNPFKKYYFYSEAKKLRQYEFNILPNATHIASITTSDNDLLNKKYENSFYLPVFHANDNISIKPGKGRYALYHGNLGVGENQQAALYLVKKIFNQLPGTNLVIAGMNPDKELKLAISKYKNIKLVENLNTDAINDLILNAHLNILPTFQETGIKLKLINVLYKGRFCIVNDKMVNNTGLSSLCIIAENDKDFRYKINEYFEKSFKQSEINERKIVLNKLFCNKKSVEKLIKKLNFDNFDF